MRALVAITLAVCSLPLMGCSRWRSCPAEPPALAPQQYGGNYPNSYDPSSRPNSYERRDGATGTTPYRHQTPMHKTHAFAQATLMGGRQIHIAKLRTFRRIKAY